MQISFIIHSFYPAVIYGGPIFSTLHTCEELSKLEDMEIRVSTTNTNMTTRLDVQTNKWIKFADHFFVKYYNETKIDKFSIPFLFNIWKDIKSADAIHITSVFSMHTPITLFYITLQKKPVMLSSRGQFGSWCLANGNRFKQKWLDWVIKPFIKRITWHATAKQEKEEILAIFPEAKVKIISNGIDYERFQKNSVLSRQEFMYKYANQTTEVEKIIVTMGRLQKKKGFDILIDSFIQVLEKYPEAKLLIAGEDEGEEKNLIRQIKDLELQDKVFLTGSIDGQEKIDFFSNADLFALPSHNENFGNVYIESLAAGTPIIASRNTPWSEVEETDCGRWVNNSVDETAAAILQMLEKDREQIRCNAKTLAKKYDWKNIAIKFKRAFEEMMEKR